MLFRSEIVRDILAFSGIHMLSPEVFDLMAGWPAKFSIIDFYLATCASNRILAHIPASLHLQDMGTPEAVESFKVL